MTEVEMALETMLNPHTEPETSAQSLKLVTIVDRNPRAKMHSLLIWEF